MQLFVPFTLETFYTVVGSLEQVSGEDRKEQEVRGEIPLL